MIQYLEITNEDEWLEKRKGYVTSTEVSSLYGENPYKTFYELWHIKRGLIDEPQLDSNYVLFGKIVEPAIVEMIKLENPEWVIEPCNVFGYDDTDKIGSSFDYYVTIDGVRGLLEIKSTSYAEYKKQYFEDDNGDIEAPIHYEIQAQVELELMPDAAFIMQVAFLADTRTLKYIRRERDAEMAQEMRKAVRDFWAMQSPPEPDYSRDKQLIAKLAPSCDHDRVLDATENMEISELAAMYNAEKTLEKQSKDNADRFYAELMHKLGKAKYAYTNDFRITVSDIKPTAGTLVTEDMLGEYIGARSGFKRITVTQTKGNK
jgi:predicted phage-related endonuclease